MHNVISHCTFLYVFVNPAYKQQFKHQKPIAKSKFFLKSVNAKSKVFFKNVMNFLSHVLKIMEKNAKNVKNMPITTKIATFRLSEDDNLVCRKALEPFLQIKSRTGTGILYFQHQKSVKKKMSNYLFFCAY